MWLLLLLGSSIPLIRGGTQLVDFETLYFAKVQSEIAALNIAWLESIFGMSWDQLVLFKTWLFHWVFQWRVSLGVLGLGVPVALAPARLASPVQDLSSPPRYI